MKNRQVDKKVSKQVRIDTGYHQLIRVEAAKRSVSIKMLLEEYIVDGLDRERKI